MQESLFSYKYNTTLLHKTPALAKIIFLCFVSIRLFSQNEIDILNSFFQCGFYFLLGCILFFIGKVDFRNIKKLLFIPTICSGIILISSIEFSDSIKFNFENSITVMLSPQGEPLSEKLVLDLAKYDQIIMLCGHYEGFDERIREIINPKEISIGDFVLTGGELPSLCLMDAVSRKIEGTLGKIESAHDDSFSNGLLEYPQYTKPRDFRGYKVPEVLLNGNHKEINEFRLNQQLERTKSRRPDLYDKYMKERS